MNTFSKSLAPSLRISYLVLPPELVELYNKNFSFYSSSVSVFEQYTLSKFLSDGYFERHINRMRKIYRTKIELIKSELTKSSLINILKIEGDITGLNFLLKVTNGMSEKQLVERALQYKVRLNALSSYYTTGSHGSIVKATKNPLMSSYFSLKRSDNQGAFIVMGYSGISTDDIPKAIKALEKAWLI